MTMEINEMSPADWEDVRGIYLEGIATGEATFETEAPSWEQWDANHLRFARLVAKADGVMSGWAALSPDRKSTRLNSSHIQKSRMPSSA